MKEIQIRPFNNLKNIFFILKNIISKLCCAFVDLMKLNKMQHEKSLGIQLLLEVESKARLIVNNYQS